MAILEERDLDFVVSVISPNARNKERIKIAIREDRDFRERIIGEDLLFERIVNNRQLIIGTSFTLYFEVLLRRSLKEMRKSIYTVDRSVSQKIPVFDTIDTLNFVHEEGVLDYLISLLVSFVTHEEETATDIDINNLIKLGIDATDDQRFEVYKRIADVCLLVLGVFPEYVMYDYDYLFLNKKIPITGKLMRTMGDYEILGKECYELAAMHEKARANNLDKILRSFSRKFYLAKKPLNYLSKHLITL
ncbi:MAG: hypothetical protein AAB577_00835 [Patescibacteria group bacterium]